jgi:hypothetical protein
VSVKAAHGVPWEHGKVGGLFYLFRRESTFHLCCVPEFYRDSLPLFRAMGTAVMFSQVLKGVRVPLFH